MARIMKGPRDPLIKKIKRILEAYEKLNPTAQSTFYRNEEGPFHPGPIRIRIVDKRWEKWSKPQRHDEVFYFISERLTDEEMQDISVLLLLSPKEERISTLNFDFDDPIPSNT